MDQPYHQLENNDDKTIHTCSLCNCSFRTLTKTSYLEIRMFPATTKGKKYKLVRTIRCPNPSCPVTISKVIRDLTDIPSIDKKLSMSIDKINSSITTTRPPHITPWSDTVGHKVLCKCGYQARPKLASIYRSPVYSSENPFEWKTQCPQCFSSVVVGSVKSIPFDFRPRY